MKNYTYLKDGFEGKLYDAQNGDDRLLIVIQGLKGLELPEKYAELFSAKGYSTLALQYYGAEGQPSDMRAIPLEQFQTAIDCLKAHDNGRFKRFGIYGNSKGAGMALLAASVVPDLSLVIAASSSDTSCRAPARKRTIPARPWFLSTVRISPMCLPSMFFPTS